MCVTCPTCVWNDLIDIAIFSSQWSRFKHGSKIIRDEKLSVMFQIGSSENKTWTESAGIAGMTALMSTLAGEMDTSIPNSDAGPSDRLPFPVIPHASLGETRHFGGALQRDRGLPQNYCSATLHVDSENVKFNIVSRLIMSVIERGLLSKNVFDLTFVLAANEQDELPERALCTLRPVRISANDIALPTIFVYESYRRPSERRTGASQNAGYFNTAMGQFSLKRMTMLSQRLFGVRLMEDSADDEEGPPSSAQLTLKGTHVRAGNHEAILDSFRSSGVATDCPIQQSVNHLIEILENVRVPVRRDHLLLYPFASAVPLSLLEKQSASDGTLHDKDLMSMPILLLVTRAEIERHFVASNCHMKKAAIRVVETAAWRGQTFPIDLRLCRIELQSGQFFQQGIDMGGRPVFYFRNMGLGPWRKDTDASVAAVLHRLDGALRDFSNLTDDVTCTLIVIMGKPYKGLFKRKGGANASVDGDDKGEDELGESMNSMSVIESHEQRADGNIIANPRVNPNETWQIQTNRKLIRQLINLISAHYPERLHQALVVIKPSHTITLRKLWGYHTLSSIVEAPVTRSKVKLLAKFSELQKYVSRQELSVIAGGDDPIDPGVFGLEDY